nr:AAA family ATPase [uncultured Sphaerochaeta sp.]
MMTLKEALAITGMTLSDAGDLVGMGKSAISRVKSHDYPNWQNIEAAIIKKMAEAGLFKDDVEIDTPEEGSLVVNSSAFISTQNVVALNALGNDLLDPATTLNSSIGMVTGAAGYGKTTAIQHFAANNNQSVYVLYMEGYTLSMIIRKIALELTGSNRRTFDNNLSIIKEATSIYRKLIIIDEADRMPLRVIESLRNINEYCGAPLMLVGEESLASKMETIPRLKSRVRKPEIVFRPLTVVDVATYYQMAVGLDISSSASVCQTLLRWAGKDFRVLVNDAQHLIARMNASGLSSLTEEVINAYKPYRT